MNSLLQLCVTLRVLPQLDALLLCREEAEFTVQKYLSGVTCRSCSSLRIQHIILTSRNDSNIYARILKFKIHRTNDFHVLRLVEAPQSDSVAASNIKWTRFENREQRSWFLKADLDVTRLGWFCRIHRELLDMARLAHRLTIHDGCWLISDEGLRQAGGSWNVGGLNLDAALPIPQSNAAGWLRDLSVGHLSIMKLDVAVEINTHQVLAVRSESQRINIMFMAHQVHLGITQKIIHNDHASSAICYHWFRRMKDWDGPGRHWQLASTVKLRCTPSADYIHKNEVFWLPIILATQSRI